MKIQRRKGWRRFVAAGSILALGCVGVLTTPGSLAASERRPRLTAPQVLRVFANNDADVAKLQRAGVDLLEAREGNQLFVMGDTEVLVRLRRLGFKVLPEAPLSPQPETAAIEPSAAAAPTFYGGYRTVAEHHAHLDAVAATRPDLAAVVDYGDSWRKVTGQGGIDLKTICLTKRQPGDCALQPSTTKPRFLLMAAIHARELSTSELAYRWIDHLVANYGVDPDVTWLVDNNELWVVPVVNPDGRAIVEQGGNAPYLQRKNADTSAAGSAVCANPPTASSQAGVDLNRNAATANWGGVGTSSNPCDQTFKGANPASEPEQQALQSLLSSLFADSKGPNRNDPAAAATSGVLITLHSYSNFVLFPYGDARTGGYAPNDAGLRNLGFRFTSYNGYRAGTGDEILYATTGTTDDWSYGTLGVPSFTFEIGPVSGVCSGFTPSYACQDSTFWPKNLGAFLYAAKAARDPYVTPNGPTTSGVALSARSVTAGTNVVVSATSSDRAYGTLGPGTAGLPNPVAQNVTQGRYVIDTKPWQATTFNPMTATDGAFNSSSEGIRATISTTGLAAGRHTVYVQGADAAGNWGPPTAVFLSIT